jgi:hypothetical protein
MAGHFHASHRIFEPRTFHRRTRQRFARIREVELLRSLGREPSSTEKIMIACIVTDEWDIRRVNAKIERGEELSDRDMQAHENAKDRLTRNLYRLGLQPAESASSAPASRPMSMAEFMARR